MFTGLIENIGTVRDFRRTGEVFRLSVDCPEIASELVCGQSVAVSGACLTVVGLREGVFDVEMMPETWERTRFRALARGDRVNLERAMKLSGRLDGHLVLGHVDGTAELVELLGGRTKTARFRATEDLGRYVIEKGSVALDGVSLTVAGVEDARGSCRFSVGLIPATLQNCTLSRIEPGELVNVETDVVGKYVERFLRFRKNGDTAGKSGGLTLEELWNLGY